MLEDIKQALLQAGVVGAGGAGFPTGMKLAPGADTLLINGAECEPLLYTDYILLREELQKVVLGAEIMMKAAGVSKAYLAVKEHTASRLSFAHGQQVGEGVTVFVLPNVYPMGDEISLIYQVLGRVVTPGNLPISAHVLVFNVETLYNVYLAIEEKQNVIEKWVSVGGKTDKGAVVKVPVGVKIMDLFDAMGIEVPADCKVLDGGPSMGKLVDPHQGVVTKTTKGLLILPQDIPAINSKMGNLQAQLARASSACCQCTLCTEMCPRALLGYPLEPHRMVRSATSVTDREDPSLVLTASLCCGCGICETAACCQGISPKMVIDRYKQTLAQNKMRYVGKEPVTPDEHRDFRMLPSERWEALLGVKEYDTPLSFQKLNLTPQKVALPLRQHVGAPAVAKVTKGQEVRAGEEIASMQGSISAPVHASISGKVTFVDETGITIER